MLNHRAEDCVSCVLDESFTDVVAIKAILLREVRHLERLLAEKAELFDVLKPSSRQTLVEAAKELDAFWRENRRS